MRFIAAIRQRWRARWKRAAGAALTIAVLSAVAIVGLALLGSELLAAWTVPGDANQALTSRSAFERLVNFEAPAETASRVKTQMMEAEECIRRAGNAPLLVKNWKYTQNPLADLVLTAINNYLFQVGQIIATIIPSLTSFINAVLTAYENLVNAYAAAVANLFSLTNVTIVNVSNVSSSAPPVSPFR